MIRKIFIGILVFLVLLIGALVAVPFLFKDKLIAIAKEEINKQVVATVDFEDVGLTVFRDFPNLSFSLKGLTVVNQAPFEGDTLANIGAFTVNLDIMSLINGGTIKVVGILLEQPNLNIKVLEDGKANYDIAKETGTAEQEEVADTSGDGSFSVQLESYEIRNANIIYDDKSALTYAKLVDLNHSGKGDFTQDLFVLATNTFAEAITVIYDGTKYLNKAKANIEMDLEMDMLNNKYTFKENTVGINELGLGFDGWIVLKDDDSYDLDLTFNTKQSTFKSILSMVPAVYTADFADVKTDGKLLLGGYAKGTYKEENYPAFGLNMEVSNAMFQYPDLPTAVNDINITTKITHPGGDLDKMTIDIPRFDMKLGQDPFSMKANIRNPMTDPLVDASLKANMDLSRVPSYYPLEGVTQIAGKLDANVTAKGRMSAIEQERYQDFNAEGSIKASGVKYVSADMPAVDMSNLDMTFNPKNVRLNDLTIQVGKSDFKANGYLDNLIAYALTDDALSGSLSVSSKLLDLNEWMTEDEATTTTSTSEAGEEETVTASSAAVPANLDLTMDGSFDKIVYDNIDLKQLKGKITIKDETVSLTYLRALVLDGDIAMNGTYSTKGGGQPLVDFSYDVNNIDIPTAYNTFSTMQEMAPVAKHMTGKFSTDMKMKGRLDDSLSLDLATVLGDGRLDLQGAKLSGFKVTDKLADQFKIKELRSLDLNDFWTIFKITDGRIFVDPFDVKSGDIKMNVFGSHGLDNTLDYNILMDVPQQLLGAASAYVGDLISQANIPGLNANSLPQNMKFNIKVTGTSDDPKLKVSVVDNKGGQSAKDQLQAEFDKKKQELEDQAKAEADRLKKEAEAKAKAEADKLKQQADKAKQEAEAKAKAEAERLKKEAEEKAKKEAEKALKDKIKWPK